MDSTDKSFVWLMASIACALSIFSISAAYQVSETNKAKAQVQIEAIKAGLHQDKEGHWVK